MERRPQRERGLHQTHQALSVLRGRVAVERQAERRGEAAREELERLVEQRAERRGEAAREVTQGVAREVQMPEAEIAREELVIPWERTSHLREEQMAYERANQIILCHP